MIHETCVAAELKGVQNLSISFCAQEVADITIHGKLASPSSTEVDLRWKNNIAFAHFHSAGNWLDQR